MDATLSLLNLAGTIALLLWGVHMVQSGVQRAFGSDLRRFLARAVWERDAELDALEDSVFRDLLTHMMEDPRNISFCAHLLFCSKNVERIGDHATNIAETVFYLVTGEALPVERPKGPHEYDVHPTGTEIP